MTLFVSNGLATQDLACQIFPLCRQNAHRKQQPDDCSEFNALVTGANRGIGRALVEALLRSKVSRVYAAARDTAPLKDLAGENCKDMIAVRLDLNDPATIVAAAKQAALAICAASSRF
jgi:nucleoside-diphosphate-sugar epimerase